MKTCKASKWLSKRPLEPTGTSGLCHLSRAFWRPGREARESLPVLRLLAPVLQPVRAAAIHQDARRFFQRIAQGTTMDTQCADDVRAQTGSLDRLTQVIEMALQLDNAFALVDEALAQDPKAQELRAALDRVPVRGLCRLVSVARGT